MTPSEIKRAIWELGLTQAQAARLLDVTLRTLQRLVEDRDDPPPPPRRVVRLLRAYLAGYRPDDWPDRNSGRPRPRRAA